MVAMVIRRYYHGHHVEYGLPDGQIMRVPLTFANGTIRPGCHRDRRLGTDLFDQSSFVLDRVSPVNGNTLRATSRFRAESLAR